MQLRTEKIQVAPAPAREGRGYVVLAVWGDHLTWHDGPVPVEQKLDGLQVLIFLHRAPAAMWAVLTAWDNLASGKTAQATQTFQVRQVHFYEATQTFGLNIVEGPVLCLLEGGIEAAQFSIPAQGQEKIGSTALAHPNAATPPHLPCR